jgi:glycosyltransferase involved in cell wall biosynthesis
LGLFFIKPAYSKISSSPTKLAEILAMGIPVVTNAGVGDSDWIAEKYRTGGVVKEFTPAEYARAIDELPALLKIPPEEIRLAAESYFSLDIGVQAYRRIYTSIASALK